MTKMTINNNADAPTNSDNVNRYEAKIWDLLDNEFEGGNHNGLEILTALSIIVKKLSQGMGVTIDVEVSSTPPEPRDGKEL